jgi:hypothetical protein
VTYFNVGDSSVSEDVPLGSGGEYIHLRLVINKESGVLVRIDFL